MFFTDILSPLWTHVSFTGSLSHQISAFFPKPRAQFSFKSAVLESDWSERWTRFVRVRKTEKMADEYEEEGVGDCSSRRLLGVRLAVRELMREALHSKENSEILADLRATGISDLGTLLQ